MRLLLATENPGKVAQIRESLEKCTIPIVALSDLRIPSIHVEEHGKTIEDNARLKARAYFKYLQKHGVMDTAVLADDGGLEIDAIGGEPGARAKRWCGQDNPDDETVIRYALKRMEGILWEKRTARFRVAQVLIFPDGQERIVTGTTEGRMMEDYRHNKVPGLPYGALLWVDAAQKVYDDLTAEEKMKYTHREIVLKKIRELLCSTQNISENTSKK